MLRTNFSPYGLFSIPVLGYTLLIDFVSAPLMLWRAGHCSPCVSRSLGLSSELATCVQHNPFGIKIFLGGVHRCCTPFLISRVRKWQAWDWPRVLRRRTRVELTVSQACCVCRLRWGDQVCLIRCSDSAHTRPEGT